MRGMTWNEQSAAGGGNSWGNRNPWDEAPPPSGNTPGPREREWATDSFPPVQPAPAAPAAQHPQSRPSWVLPVVAVGALIGLGGLGAAGWSQGWFGSSAAPEPIVVTSTYVVPAEPASPAPVQIREPVPAGALQVGGTTSGIGEEGRFTRFYAGTEVTSAPFAEAVAREFRRVYTPDASPSLTLTAWSPVTGQNYSMTCSDNGSYVTCRGGNNAVVYIQ